MEPTHPMRAAEAIQRAAAETGFDWPDLIGVWEKVREEVAELEQAASHDERVDELGDLLFMLVNVARHLRIDPATALSAANQKFTRRFAHVQQRLRDTDPLPPGTSPAARLAVMETFWREAKELESAASES